MEEAVDKMMMWLLSSVSLNPTLLQNMPEIAN
jgi:hypothetical protein